MSIPSKHVLVTGNLGYIGAVLTGLLKERGYTVVGLDTGFYEECMLAPVVRPDTQIKKDIRTVIPADLAGVGSVIHLAALSNDPLGELAPALTEEINFQATVKLARLAKEAGVSRFIYSSSQSMYGISNADAELDEDSSEKNPLTAYARTKWEAERALKKLNGEGFTVVCLRPSTVFGASPMLRTDIVLNNLLACGYTMGAIEIKSDGTPWRPVVHVEDVSRAFIAALEAPAAIVSGESFNVGAGNFTVRDLAEAAQHVVPGSRLTFTGEHGTDARTYRVSFAKIVRVLGDRWRPEWSLERGGTELVRFFKKVNFTEEMFRGRQTTRLTQIKFLMGTGALDQDLFWRRGAVGDGARTE